MSKTDGNVESLLLTAGHSNGNPNEANYSDTKVRKFSTTNIKMFEFSFK